MADSVAPSRAPGRHQRKLRNLLLDPAFQLKYAGYLVGIAVFLSASLGFLVVRTSSELVAQSQRTVAQGERIVALGDEVVDESRKVSAVVRMNIVKDPVYQNDAALLEAFNSEADEQDGRLAKQKASLEEQRTALSREAKAIVASQERLIFTVFAALFVLVVGIGLAGIVVTHKVSGPIFKMKRHLRAVARGDLGVPWGLRKGDELVDFFETFRQMVIALRGHKQKELEELRLAIEELRGDVPEERLARLEQLASNCERSLADAPPALSSISSV